MDSRTSIMNIYGGERLLPTKAGTDDGQEHDGWMDGTTTNALLGGGLLIGEHFSQKRVSQKGDGRSADSVTFLTANFLG